MKPVNLIIIGQKLENPGDLDSTDHLQLKEVYVLSTATRGTVKSHNLKLDDDNVAEFVFDDKTT